MSFSLTDFLSPESLKDVGKSKREIVMIAADKLHPTDGNFYSRDDDRVQKMAASILMLSTPGKIGIQQNLVVRPIPDTDEYTILAGETRWSAVMQLLESGDLDTDQIPCEIEQEDDPIRDELILILTNSTQRVRSDAEKMHEVKRLRELLEEYRKSHKLDGTIQKAIGDLLGISKTKVGTLENIDRNLSPELLEEYEKGNINTSVANKLAGLNADAQQAGKKMLDVKGAITADDVRTLTKQEEEPEAEQRPMFQKCITGWSKYGNCVCCGYDGAQCCNQCKQSCNSRCGWIDHPYIPDKEEGADGSEPVPYEMKYEMNEETESVETVNTSFEMKGKTKEDSGSDFNNNEESNINDRNYFFIKRMDALEADLKEYLSLGNLTADIKMMVTELANDVLASFMSDDKPLYEIPDIDLMRVDYAGETSVDLQDFSFRFYTKVVEMVLNVVGSFADNIADSIMTEGKYERNSDQEDTTA